MFKKNIKIILFLCFMILTGNLFAEKKDKEIAVTIYNNDLALVKDVRKISVKSGISELCFADVASKIDPTSVHFKSITAPDKISILEQNYEYDLVSTDKILSKYVD